MERVQIATHITKLFVKTTILFLQCSVHTLVASMCMAASQSPQIPLHERALFDTTLYGFKVTVLSNTTPFNTAVWI